MANSPDMPKISELTFEQAQAELETLVDRMEKGDQALEHSLSDFERGVALMNHCQKLLSAAEQKVEVLIKDNDGLFKTEPFDTESH